MRAEIIKSLQEALWKHKDDTPVRERNEEMVQALLLVAATLYAGRYCLPCNGDFFSKLAEAAMQAMDDVRKSETEKG